ncbi:MAG: trypsin-like peptidase domain-containing protein [Longimicrobiales bacterium]
MTDRITQEQEGAIVKIRARYQGQSDWGTGFVVASDRILTAYHVVGDRRADGTVFYTGTVVFGDGTEVPFGVVEGAHDKQADWALLQVDVPEGITPLPLSEVWPSDQDFRSYGFPKDNPQGLAVRGTIEYDRAPLGDVRVIQVFCQEFAASGGGVANGASGSPVLVDGRVVGLLRFTLTDGDGRSKGTLYACPATELAGRDDVSVLPARKPVLGDLTQEELDRVVGAVGQVRVGDVAATGYLLAPEWVAAWSEELVGRPEGTPVQVQLRDGVHEGTLVCADAGHACALVRLGTPVSGVEPLALARCDQGDAGWVAHGFPAARFPFPLQATGVVRSPAQTPMGGGPAAMILHSEEFSSAAESELAGLEGAPVLVQRAVVGHFRKAMGFQQALATRSEDVLALLESVRDTPAAGPPLPMAAAPVPADGPVTPPTIEADAYHVAVCYRDHTPDAEWAHALGQRLEGAGFRVLFDGYEVADDVAARTGPASGGDPPTPLERARSAVVVAGTAWQGFEAGRAVDAYLLSRQDANPSFRAIPALLEGAPPPTGWRDRPGIRFDGAPQGRALEELEHYILGAAPPREGTAAAAVLRARTGPADELIEAVQAAERTPAASPDPADSSEGDVRAAESGGALRVLELWKQWQEAGTPDPAAALAVGHSLIRLAHPERALQVLEHAGTGTRARQLQALAMSSDPERLDDAIEILEQLRREGQKDSETLGLLAARLKQRAKMTDNRTDLRASHALYLEAFERTREHYPGINAASTALGIGALEDGRRIAAEVQAVIEATPEAERDRWATASLGEARLIQGDLDAARRDYGAFIMKEHSDLRAQVVMRRQIRWNLEWLGQPIDALDDLFDIPGVAAFVGHMTDAPDRPTPRFPERCVASVRKGIAASLREHQIRIGYCSGARGADLLFVRELDRRGGEVNVILPFPREAFVAASVGPDPEWIEEFNELLDRERVEVETLLDEDPGTEEGRIAAFVRCNREIRERALARAVQLDQEPVLVHVWNGEPGDGSGGTADLVRAWRRLDLPEAAVPIDL